MLTILMVAGKKRAPRSMVPKRADDAQLELNMNLFSSSQQIRSGGDPEGAYTNTHSMPLIDVMCRLGTFFFVMLPYPLQPNTHTFKVVVDTSIKFQGV